METREKLIQILQDYENGEIVNIIDTADAIEQLFKPEWVSVKERLPEKNGSYLVVAELSEGPKVMSIEYYDVWFVRGNGEIKNQNKVTHWMCFPSLPNPPKV